MNEELYTKLLNADEDEFNEIWENLNSEDRTNFMLKYVLKYYKIENNEN